MFANGRGKKAVSLLLVLLVAVCAVIFSSGEVRLPQEGKKVKKDNKLTLDISHAEEGYFLAKGPKSKKRLKLTVEAGGAKLQYDINTDGEYEVFPLQFGRTNYVISLWAQAEGKKYGKVGQIKVSPKMEDELSCFLYPNQYVNYTADTPCVLKAIELCEGMTDPEEIFQTIRGFVIKNFTYDYIKSVTVAGSSGMLPDIEGCWEGRKGICQDLSAMTCAMLRSQGVPARLIIGQLGSGTPHAWVLAVVNGEDVFFDPTAEVGASNKAETYTTLRWY